VYSYILALEMEPALCQWYRHIFVPYYILLFGTTQTVKYNWERKYADTIGTMLVPLTGHFQCKNITIHCVPKRPPFK